VAEPAIGRRRLLVLFVVTALALLTFDRRGNSVIDSGRRVLGEALSPVQAVLRTVSSPLGNAWKGITDYDDLERENAELRDQIDAAVGAAAAAEAVIYENNELRADLGLPTLQQIPRVAAEVISGSPSNFDLTITINQGANRGIKVGNPVITSAGLVGRVTKVTRNTATVRLINDPELSVSVRFLARECIEGQPLTPTSAPNDPSIPIVTVQPDATSPPVPPPETVVPPTTLPPLPETTPPPSTTPPSTAPPTTVGNTTTTTIDPSTISGAELGELVGRGRGRPLGVDRVGRDDCIMVGDPVVTSGIRESLFPSGLPIGKVVQAQGQRGSLDMLVRVEPYADLDRLYFVTVLLYDGDAAYADG
jgi:cell shape-determining protein MreC